MPEATMDENGHVMPRQDQVRLTRQVPRMKAKAQSRRVQIASDDQFRASVRPTDPLHPLASIFNGEAIDQRSTSCFQQCPDA